MPPEHTGNRGKAIGIAIALHIVLGLVLVVGIHFSDYKPLSGPKAEVIKARVLTAPPAKQPPVEQPKPVEPPEPPEPVVDPAEEERRRQKEAEQLKQRQAEEQARLEAEQQQRKEVEAQARQKAEADAKRKAEQAEKKKAEAAEKKKAEEAAKRKKAEEEARKKTEAEQRAREQALQEALAQEQQERELNPLIDAYRNAIGQKIAQNWLQPPSLSPDLRCMVRVVQLPDGSVTSATISKGSGNAVFDESVIKAIYKASPLPQPPSPEVFDREVDVAFCSTGKAC